MHVIINIKGRTTYAAHFIIPFEQVITSDTDAFELTLSSALHATWESKKAFKYALTHPAKFVWCNDSFTEGLVSILHPSRPALGKTHFFKPVLRLSGEQLLRLSDIAPRRDTPIPESGASVFSVESLAEHVFSPNVGLEQSS